MFSLRTHVIICASLFAAILVIAIGGNALQAAGVIRNLGSLQLPFLILIFGLFIAFGFSAIPVMVQLVLGFQRQVGNENAPAVAATLRAERWIIYAIWGILAAGLIVAVPAAIKGGLFTTAAGSGTAPRDERISIGPSSGVLVARPGMLLSDVVRNSTLHIDPANQTSWTGSVAGGAVFDFRIAGTGIVFPRCRYYFFSTYTHEPGRIESINVGTSSATMSRSELDGANATLRGRLGADGWLAGHEEYRDEEDRALHSGQTHGPEGTLWLKDGMVLDIGTRRMDDEVLGEDKASAGRWIQFVQLWAHDDYPFIERYVFARPAR
ncbi:MAG TPA: hypothetical protein VKR31_00155 [Rhizomicrobium sp.]|nr:hypothetical protein [Rhizomicrobium sp.]